MLVAGCMYVYACVLQLILFESCTHCTSQSLLECSSVFGASLGLLSLTGAGKQSPKHDSREHVTPMTPMLAPAPVQA